MIKICVKGSHKKGNLLGKHEGLINYTIGQRKGIEQISNSKYLMSNKMSNSKYQNSHCEESVESPGTKQSLESKQPLYVIGFDVEKNRLIVGADEDIYKKEMTVTDMNWINGLKNLRTEELKNIKAKIRYRHAAVPCSIRYKVESEKSEISVAFDEPQRAITPGQSAVFYSGDEVLGGGYIK